ncbi:glycogen synthase [Trueperella pyogenes]|uniref:Glycogen synthase n=1 Tax=Trueperella pyogenes TaxID=1661 RepID=A0A3S9QJF6_9ACTO|nr:glycogen synthase [Trueperella pyogenes]AWG04585.1 glycogen synthase [Trueperella pyogenes]AWG15414.1 glycogen synthase [Trueperella pyogenes]AZR04301.1 glycogen synthase [Trueperella pyogenes]AZR06132.1 glycogen synthase [Trueperella pyogenes]MCI7689175.1 glycogen synthase [Trueperella pyogenes]
MRVDLLTREYPPHVYGGAGVHVTELAKVLRAHAQVHVHAFDGPRDEDGVHGYTEIADLGGANGTLKTLGVDLLMANKTGGADLVHSHTWYANMAGHLSKLMYGIPHVISAHSLEPLRPWKREQLGGGYEISSWIEKTAYEAADGIVAVSHGMREDILRSYPEVDPAKVRVIHNGIDLEDWKAPQTEEEWDQAREYFRSYGLDPDKPTIIFVGRITRQKGVPGLLRALQYVPEDVQVILCAGAPDTKEILAETRALVEELCKERDGVVWIDEHLPHAKIVALESCSTTFVTPSVYEPLGIVNLEAMAVGLPVVGTATGGIPDCIDDGVTGILVPIEQKQDGTGTPLDPEQFERDLGLALAAMVADPQRAKEMGKAGRKRVEEHFSWESIAIKTMAFYEDILGR